MDSLRRLLQIAPPALPYGISFMLSRILFAVALALALGGCASIAPHDLAAETVASFHVKEVAVVFPPGARLNYTPAENDLAEMKGLSAGAAELDALVASPEGQAYIRQRATQKTQAAFQRKVTPLLQGPVPARVEVAVLNIDVPGLARTVLLGGPAFLKARISLTKLSTGAVVATMPDKTVGASRAGGPIGGLTQAAMESSGLAREPYDRLAETLAGDYANWLLKKE